MSTIADSQADPAASSSTTPAEAGSIWPALAGLRWFLASVVLCSHTTSYSHAPAFFGFIHRFGARAAVIGFFLVSGYSIAHSITNRPSGFLKRRIQRIYPIFVVSFMVALIPYALWGNNIAVYSPSHTIHMSMPSIVSAIGSAFLLNGFLVDRVETLGIAWTLSIECFFYLLAPLFIKSPRPYLWALSLLSCVAYIGHNKLLHHHDIVEARHGIGALILLWPWLLGFIAFLERGNRKVEATIAVLSSLMIWRWSQDGAPWAVITILISIGIIVLAPKVSGRMAKGLNLLGDLSYPLYIIQGPVFVLLLGGPTARPYYVLALAPVLAAIALYFLVDLPFRKRVRKTNLAR